MKINFWNLGFGIWDLLKWIFPLKLYLHILQLEEYSLTRFLRWLVRNPLKRSVEEKKPLVWTEKATFLYRLSLLILIIFWSFLLLACPLAIWFVIGLALILQPWLLLSLAMTIRKPYEIVNRIHVRCKTRAKIRRLKSKGLKVIGISGSYGKTTTKEFLYHLLRQNHRVLRTPGSYNTLFGIDKVVGLELDEHYQFFICEMGAYKRGEIAELCSTVEPDYGILTGINEQHLERFGSIENTVEAKFELIDWVLKHRGKMVVNVGNSYIAAEIKNREVEKAVVGYNSSTVPSPISQNWDGAKTLCRLLGILPKQIAVAQKDTPVIPHRLQIIKRPGLTVINDTYSSNPDGFLAALKFLAQKPGHKVVVTSGIVELGKATENIHLNLGKETGKVADEVVLVGKSPRTESLKNGLERTSFKGKTHFVSGVGEALRVLSKTKNLVVLFENDLPDQY